MARLGAIDAALVRLLGQDFSLVGSGGKSVANKLVASLIKKVPVASLGQDDLSSDSVIVLSVNLFSVLMVRMMSSDQPCHSSQIELVEFLLQVFGAGAGDEASVLQSTASSSGKHKFSTAPGTECMICTRCMFDSTSLVFYIAHTRF
jgi:hypothetical protein